MLDVVIPVYNGATTIGETLAALLRQKGAGETWQRIIVVDDGSTDDTAAVVQSMADDRVQLIRADERSGRGGACNTGAKASDADVILFLDADCWPLRTDLINRHAQMMASGAAVSFGRIQGSGEGFWARLAAQVAREREQRAKAGDFLGMTSWNMALPRELYLAVGGFCGEYHNYGFEDRDFLSVLDLDSRHVIFEPQAAVARYVDRSVAILCRKMEEAGRYTAEIFRERHPDQYARMNYSRVDINTASPIFRLSFPALNLLPKPLKWLSSVLVDVAWVPFRLRVFLLRSAMALAFMRGTAYQKAIR